MSEQNEDKKIPMVVFTKYGPFAVVDVDKVENTNGEILPKATVQSLCRCGKSKYKPYCDGAHSKVGFVGDKKDGRSKDKTRDFVGKDITIHDNRGVCSHDGSCLRLLPTVFNLSLRVWINPDGDTPEKIMETIHQCPSGSLSYTYQGKRWEGKKGEPKIKIVKDGPFELSGDIIIKDDMNSKPEIKAHCTLCRCGESKNRPFCDGTHFEVDFDI